MTAPRDITRLDTDILILGSGGAGLFAALHASDAAPPGTRITMAAKGLIGKCGCTRMVQGGYNAALGADDSVERHFMDTVLGGKWLCNQEMAWTLCGMAVERVRQLENEMGCFFDRNTDGTIHQKPFAGQSADRTVHKGDLTGIEIINRLMEQLRARRVERLEEHRALALVPAANANALSGVLMTNIRTGGFVFMRARAVLLATGGGPTMYRYHTPSGDKAMDGLAMALRAGLSLRDMEMVQFHPTGLLAGENTRMTGTVLEEGLRGAGGVLLDGAGRRFMFDYDDKAERATRDIVSRAIYEQMQAGNTTENGGVHISMERLAPDEVRARFKGMVKRCADCGFDLAAGRVEVVPTAHYLMGGVVVDARTGTALAGLHVAGEDAGGAHGANRLGGNGVANSTVFGGVAGERMGEAVAAGAALHEPDREILEREMARALHPLDQGLSGRSGAGARAATRATGRGAGKGGAGEDGARGLVAIRARLQQVMWDHVGVVRTRAGLERGLRELDEIDERLMRTGIDGTALAYNLTWHDWLNLRSLVDVSRVIASAGLARENSRGAHYRADFPDEGSLEESSFTCAQLAGGVTGRAGGGSARGATGPSAGAKIEVRHERVEFTRVRPGETLCATRETP